MSCFSRLFWQLLHCYTRIKLLHLRTLLESFFVAFFLSFFLSIPIIYFQMETISIHLYIFCSFIFCQRCNFIYKIRFYRITITPVLALRITSLLYWFTKRAQKLLVPRLLIKSFDCCLLFLRIFSLFYLIFYLFNFLLFLKHLRRTIHACT